MLFVTSADGSKAIDAVTYAELKSDSRKAARELKKLLKENAEKEEEEAYRGGRRKGEEDKDGRGHVTRFTLSLLKANGC